MMPLRDTGRPEGGTGSGRALVAVIIVSFNTRDLTLACIRSLKEHSRSCALEIIVVDNASRDDSVAAIAREHPDVRLVVNKDNKGFAAANNQGLAIAGGEWLLLLNSDTELTEDSLGATLRCAAAHPRCGVVGCRLIGRDGRQQSSVFRYLSLREMAINMFVPNRLMRRSRLLGFSRYTSVDRDRTLAVEVVAGAYMLLPRKVYETVGGMDEDFFMYGEEAEWCWRIRRAGWDVLYCPDTRITHHGGASAKQDWSSMSLALAKSQVLFLRKTRGTAVAWLANALMTLRDLPRGLLWLALRLAPGQRAAEIRGGLENSVRRLPFYVRGLVGRGWLATPMSVRGAAREGAAR